MIHFGPRIDTQIPFLTPELLRLGGVRLPYNWHVQDLFLSVTYRFETIQDYIYRNQVYIALFNETRSNKEIAKMVPND